MKRLRSLWLAAIIAALPCTLASQTLPTDDAVIRRMWSLGMDSSHTERLAQVLNDSIGMRLSGTAGFQSAVDWLLATYRGWGVPVRSERYGSAPGWRMGAVSMALLAPRVQSLEATMLAWSPGTGGRPVEGEAVLIPLLTDSAAASRWLATVRGKFVLASAPEIMCRAPQELVRNARPETVRRINAQRDSVETSWLRSIRAIDPRYNPRFGAPTRAWSLIEAAGASAIVTSYWSDGWGVNKIFSAIGSRVPVVDLSCEHYGSVARLAERNQGPRLRLIADAELLPDQPMFNVIAELRGSELPNEYVVLMAHLDSWHGATGATDNGTGTITMLEAMRILSQAYPRPRRTIIVGHWGAEEQGLIGSRSFTEDHPEVLRGLQAAFNQDNGTWRFELIEGQGFAQSGTFIARWLARLPAELSNGIRTEFPGAQNNPGSDHSAFICHGVPTFRFQSPYDEYRQYTWHTNRDTYDKIVFDDLRANATVAAMMAYAASEDRDRFPRDRATLPPGPNGQPRAWPTCGQAARNPAPRE